jgi:hypothetical protein
MNRNVRAYACGALCITAPVGFECCVDDGLCSLAERPVDQFEVPEAYLGVNSLLSSGWNHLGVTAEHT